MTSSATVQRMARPAIRAAREVLSTPIVAWPMIKTLVEPWPDPVQPSERRVGHGLIWRVCPPDFPMYGRRSDCRGSATPDTYWQPYHDVLQRCVDEAQARFGMAYQLPLDAVI